jgi:hypothetical protein
MRRLAKGLGIAVLVLIVAVAVLYGVGAALPAEHVATEVAVVPARPDAVWARIVDFDGQEGWRSTVADVRVVDGRIEEVDAWGDVTAFAVDERIERSKLVLRVLGDGPFGGTWTILVAADPGGTRVEITERGEIRPPLLRVLAKLFFDPHETARTWLADLGRSFAR